MGLDRKGVRLAKASLAKGNTTKVDITGEYEDDRQRFRNMAVALGIDFLSGNQVDHNRTTDDIDLLKTRDHVHGNMAILALIEESFTTALKLAYDGYETRIADLETRLANYETHTHEYEDNDGTADTTRSTTGVQ